MIIERPPYLNMEVFLSSVKLKSYNLEKMIFYDKTLILLSFVHFTHKIKPSNPYGIYCMQNRRHAFIMTKIFLNLKFLWKKIELECSLDYNLRMNNTIQKLNYSKIK